MNLIHQHPAVFGVAAYWLFSAIIGGMPDPTSQSSVGYIWMHRSFHFLAGNIAAAVQSKFPNLPPGTTVEQTVVQKTTSSTPPTA